MPARKAVAAVPKTLPIKKKKKPTPAKKPVKQITSEGFQRMIDVMKAAGFSQRRIQEELERDIFERAEKQKRELAAHELGKPP